MRVLLLGGGGREHALARALAQSPSLTKLYAAPGNPGIAQHAELLALAIADPAAVVAAARKLAVELVVVGPEAPLVAGVANALRAAGVAVFGPDAAAAQLEGSKGFTKQLCAEAGIPTAAFARCRSPADAAAALDRFGLPVVVKADGLAAGKGVVVAQSRAEADAAVAALLPAHGELVIEEFMAGEEAGLFALSDGRSVRLFATAQDHKRVGDGDTGPNTGGMGAFSPAVALTPALAAQAMREIVVPTVAALAARGTPFFGVLYAGLMLTAAGPKLVEYNVRFGDPEAEAILPRFEGDLAQALLLTATGRLHEAEWGWRSEAALTVVVAAEGYPGTPRTGGQIEGIEAAEAEGAIVFQAGTRAEGGALVAAGGRVLAVTALGPDLAAARTQAYRALARIEFADGFWRRDIGWRALRHEAKANP